MKRKKTKIDIEIDEVKPRIPRQSGRSSTFGDRRTKRKRTREAQKREWNREQ